MGTYIKSQMCVHVAHFLQCSRNAFDNKPPINQFLSQTSRSCLRSPFFPPNNNIVHSWIGSKAYGVHDGRRSRAGCLK